MAHEALLTGWPRLARWLEDDAAGRAVRRHLAPAARDWDAGGRPDDELYRGARLAAALDWAAGPDADVTPLEQDFLDASRARADAELTEAATAPAREARARHRTRRLAIGLAAVLVARSSRPVWPCARSGRSSARPCWPRRTGWRRCPGRSASSTCPMLLAAQGFRLADTAETRDGLRAAVDGHERALQVMPLSMYANERQRWATTAGRSSSSESARICSTWTVLSGAQPGVTAQLSAGWGNHRTLDASPVEPSSPPRAGQGGPVAPVVRRSTVASDWS